MKLAIDFRYSEIAYELWALAHMLEVIEPAMDVLSAQDEAQTLYELRASPWTDDEGERGLAYQDIDEKRDYVLPRFMRGPFIVSLWACFESSVGAVARRLYDDGKAAVRLGELRAESFPRRANRYFDAGVGMPLDPDAARYSRLEDLYTVRNALAHANGLREGMSAEEWSRLRGAAERHDLQLNSHRGVLLPTREYIEAAYRDVASSLRSLVDRARELSDLGASDARRS